MKRGYVRLVLCMAWLGTVQAMIAPSPAAADLGARAGAPHLQAPPPESGPVLWYFWRDACPFCDLAESWLVELEEALPELVVRRVEVVRDPAGRDLFIEMMRERGEQASAVPTFIFRETVWVGFTRPLAEDIEGEIRAWLADAEPEPGRTVIDLGPFGLFEVGGHTMGTATLLIAFIDGFNPCSLWVLTILLAMILGTRSRIRIAAVGLTFLLVTAAVYGAFIGGLFVALEVAAHLGWIRVAVAALALAFGAVNVKDFFASGRGPSLTIPARFKPSIYRGGRALRKDRPLPVTLALTVGIAGGVALVELPCTAGFPVLWTTLLSEAGIAGAAFGGLLALYLLVYLSVEIALLTGAVVTLRATRLQEEHGEVLKLFGGTVMIALAVVLLVDPTLMERITGSLVVIGIAVAAATLILLVGRSRRVRDRITRSPPPGTRGERHREGSTPGERGRASGPEAP